MSGFVFGANAPGSSPAGAACARVGGFPEEFLAYFDDVALVVAGLDSAGGGEFYGTKPAVADASSVSRSVLWGPAGGDLLRLQSRKRGMVFWRKTCQVWKDARGRCRCIGARAWRARRCGRRGGGDS